MDPLRGPRLDYQPLFGKGARAPPRHERAAEIEPTVDRVHQNMDRVHGPPYHGPWTPYSYKLRLHHKLRFDDL